METSLQSEIEAILPNIDKMKASLVANHLCQESGVEDKDDLKYVTEEDLDMLKPVQKRKLLQAWKRNNVSPKVVEQSQAPVETQEKMSKSSSGSSTCTAGSTTAADWFRKYLVPWNKMSKVLMQQLEEGKRPLPSHRRDMVRIIIKDVMTICPSPKKSQLGHIAANIVAKYPNSFKDFIGDQVVGSGYDSLLKNLTEKAQNANRGKNSSNAAAEPEKKRLKTNRTDSYGCVNYSPEELPQKESEETQMQKKEEMKLIALQKGQTKDCQQKLKNNMKDTYVSQRKDIVEKQLPVPELCAEWPYLFTVGGMCLHAELLVGINMKTEIEKAFQQKGKLILQYFRAKSAKKSVQTVLADIDKAKGASGNDKPELPGIILLLLAHFGEDAGELFIVMETTVTKQDAEKLNTERKPPMLITCGDILTADRFMLNIDGEVVHWDLSSFPDALMMLFASYYVFSIEYGEACTTMEFVQRCMVGINPDRGCKSAAKKKFRYSLNPKLLSLINSIQDYQTSVFLCEEADDGKH